MKGVDTELCYSYMGLKDPQQGSNRMGELIHTIVLGVMRGKGVGVCEGGI